MHTAKIKYWNKAKGYGFLARSDGLADVFVHINQIDQNVESADVRVGQKVTFKEGRSNQDKVQAEEVRFIAEAKR